MNMETSMILVVEDNPDDEALEGGIMGRSLRVLIIEDSEEDTQLLVRELQRGGYEVEFERVETAEAMQSALTQKTWELILSDYNLPTFSAPRALEVLRASG